LFDGLLKEIPFDLRPVDRVALALGVLDDKLAQSLELRSSVVAASGSKQMLVLVESTEVGFGLHHHRLHKGSNTCWGLSGDNHFVKLIDWLLLQNDLDAALWLADHAHSASTFDIYFLQ